MFMIVMIIGAVVWIPVLFFEIGRRGFAVLVLWLFVAPIVANFVEHGGRKLLFAQEKYQEIGSHPYVARSEDDRNRLHLMFAPNRLLFGAFGLFFLSQAFLKKRRLGPFDRTERWMGVFTVMLLGSIFFQSNVVGYGLRVGIDAFLVPFLAYFVSRRLTNEEHRLSTFIRVLGYMSAYLILMALFQGVFQPNIERVMGPFSHRDYLYVVLVVAFFMLLSNYLGGLKVTDCKQTLWFWVQRFVITLTPFVVLLMWTRGNWLGFSFGVWVFVALSFRLISFRRRLGTIALFAILVPMIIVTVHEFSPTDFMADRIGNERNIYARLAAWQAVWSSGTDQPIFGIGLGNTREVLASRVVLLGESKNLSSTHNSFLTLFSELGAFGFLTYMAIVWSIIKMGLSLHQKGTYSQQRWRGVAIISIMTAHLLPAFFSNILFIPVVSHSYVFAVFGAIAGLRDSRSQPRNDAFRRGGADGERPNDARRRVLQTA